MGSISYESAQVFLSDIIELFSSSIVSELTNVSNTIVYHIPNLCEPLNLYKLSLKYSDCKFVNFESELFPSLTLNFWSPVHVNVFSTGKVVILGKNSLSCINNVVFWINKNLL